jgi:SNF2 family DNA or RNA helicase
MCRLYLTRRSIEGDRWWNAVREEQATDRVHRMGQTRAMQVIKSITTGTIEERIDAIIARTAALSDRTLTTDDPESMKTFTREELLEIVAGR